MGRRGSAAALAVALVLAAWQPADAREPQAAPGQAPSDLAPVAQADRPYRGIFGGGTGAVRGGHLLALNASVYQEYGNNEETGVPDSAGVMREGWFLGVRGQLAFEKAGRYSRFAMRGEGSFRYVRELNETTSPRFRLEVAADGAAGSRKQHPVRFTGNVDYEPYYILSIIPSPVLPTGDTAILPTSRDDLLFQRARYIYGQAFSYEHQLSRRSYLGVFEDTRTTQANTQGLDVTSGRVGAHYGYRMSRYASLRLGYIYKLGNYGVDGTDRFESHDLDVGVDYRRPITPSRKTTFGFGAGASSVSRSTGPVWTSVASANLRHQFERGWFVQADFSRNAQLVEGFAEPFFANTIAGSLGGFLGRRVEVLASTGYSKGLVGFGSDDYSTRQGSARLRLALGKYMAVDAEGLLTHYLFDNRVTVPGTFSAGLNRWSVRCNVAIWLPLSR